MEDNECYSNGFDADIDTLLPPRKRLLAGFRKRSSGDVCSSSFRLSDDGKSLEEIIEASRATAKAAAEAAAAARAAALEKAAVAARACAAAKGALELVASLEEEAGARGNSTRKPRKQVPVKVLYKGRRLNTEHEKELAGTFHRAICGSPKAAENRACSNHVKQNEMKLFEISTAEEGLGCQGSMVCDINAEGGDMDCTDVPLREIICRRKQEGNIWTNVEASREKNAAKQCKRSCKDMAEAGTVGNGKKALIKQKKLSLSGCSVKGLEKTKGIPDSSSSSMSRSKPKATSSPIFYANPSDDAEGSGASANVEL